MIYLISVMAYDSPLPLRLSFRVRRGIPDPLMPQALLRPTRDDGDKVKS